MLCLLRPVNLGRRCGVDDHSDVAYGKAGQIAAMAGGASAAGTDAWSARQHGSLHDSLPLLCSVAARRIINITVPIPNIESDT